MQKQAPTLGRLLIMVGFALSCFGLLLFLWLAFGGPVPLQPKGYRFQASFAEATQLAKEADVRISGVSVGKVKSIETEPDGRSLALIQMDNRYAPIPKNTRAILRQKTLLGETYVELTPGSRRSGMLPENGTLPQTQVAPTVELDEIFRAFNPKTRAAFQQWQQNLASSLSGRGLDLNDALGNLGPFAQDTSALLQILKDQQGDVRNIVNGTGDVFNALSARDHELAQLISNSNRVFQTTAARNQDLKQTFEALPTFERESTKTVQRLTRFAHTTNPLVNQLHPAARQLTPTLKDLARLAPDLKALFRDLNPLITASKAGLPATEAFLDDLHPLLGELDAPLRQLNPIIRYIAAYRDELRAFFANVPAATQSAQVEPNSKGVPVHYLRTMNPTNPENLAVYPRRLGTNRTNAYMLPHGFDNLSKYLLSFETRQCGRPSPTLPQVDPSDPLHSVINGILTFTFGQAVGSTAGAVASPPCVEQPPSTLGQKTSKFPQLAADPPGGSARAAAARGRGR